MNIWEDWDRECRARGDLWEGGQRASCVSKSMWRRRVCARSRLTNKRDENKNI